MFRNYKIQHMENYIKNLFVLIIIAGIAIPAHAQKKELTESQYFKNNFKGIIQSLPAFTGWLDDSHFTILKSGKNYMVDCKNGSEKEYNKSTHKEANKLRVITKGTDLYILGSAEDVRLTNDEEKEINPTISPDENYVAYTKNNDLYTINLITKKQTRLTNDGSETILNGYASWLYTEEILGRSSQYRSFWWNPDSKRIAFFRTDDSAVPIFTITDAGGQHGVVEKIRYPKAGDTNPQVKIGIVPVAGGNITWADFNEKDDQYFGAPYWTPDGSSLIMQWINRGQDNLKLYTVNPATGAKKELYDEKQKTWIKLQDGFERINFLSNNKNFILQSDKTGWNHLYFMDTEGKEINPITSGKFTVLKIDRVDEKNKVIYFTARAKENTARTDFYKVSFNGKNLKRLTFGDYNHSFIDVSPGGSYFITSYNNVITPQKLALVNNKGKIIKELGDSKAQDFDTYSLAKTELIRVKSEDGIYDLPMKVTWPVNMDKNKKYPVLISIYGGPDKGNCWDSWTLNGNQQWFAKEGLIQVVMDHRGSGHFGKEGQNYMYRNLGFWELKDYSTMTKWLIANGNADPEKICITGFSYGGYVTCYALTHDSDIFTHGMAGGSVTDWSYYDSHYTERFMDTPAENPRGYATSSVLNYVYQYKGVLQIVHGISDDNVHIQNSISLTSKLQDLKKDFEFMAYSSSRHGWSGNKNLHFLNLKTQFIYKYLLQKNVPKGILK